MQSARYSVSIVLDPDYGQDLSSIAELGPVWIIESPQNRSAAQANWTKRPAQSHLEGISTFKGSGNTKEDQLLNIIDVIDLHHGEYSSAIPYTNLYVIGVNLTDRIQNSLFKYGFTAFENVRDGFQALRATQNN